jgi:phosphate/phosphite/phosphonate ABC transporter binding protein
MSAVRREGRIALEHTPVYTAGSGGYAAWVMTDGRKLGRYRLIDLLGTGGMGEVHLASALGAAGFEKPVVLKVLRREFGANPERTRRLLREAFIGVGLDHENLVQVLDLGEHEGTYFIAMEYVRGYNLAQITGHSIAVGEPLPVGAAVHVARAVAAALDYVHQARDQEGKSLGLIHRDVSPSNILLGLDGRIKLSDFGVASLVGEDQGAIIGKPPYLPAEAFTGAPAGAGWDVYALGVVLYETLAGQAAFPGQTEAEVVAAIARGPTPLADVRPDLPAGLIEVVTRAIARDPSARYPQAMDLRMALGRAWPREVGDEERFREVLAGICGHESFVQRFGGLRGLGSLVPTMSLRPVAPLPPPPAEAETRDAMPRSLRFGRPLRFGLSPAHGASLARSEGERLAARLAERTGRPIRTVVVADYRTLVDTLVAGEIDFGWTPPAATVVARARGATPLVLMRRNGLDTYQSAIIVHAESALRELADLRGQTVAWVDRDSASGYLFAVAEVARVLGDPARVFRREHVLGSHHAVCEAVANAWAAAGATYVSRDAAGAIRSSAWVEFMGERAGELRPIAFSPPIPGDSISCRPGLAAATAAQLTGALVGLADDVDGLALLRSIFHADEMSPPAPGAYDDVERALRVRPS